MTVELPLPPKILSPNITGAHWAVKKRAIREYRTSCGDLFLSAKLQAGWLIANGGVELEVEYRCPMKSAGYVARDTQNAIAAMKPAIDGMVDAQIVPNDSARYVAWGQFRLVTRKSDRGEGITIVVRRV